MDPKQTMSNSSRHENVAIPISQIGMIFGDLPLEPRSSSYIPVIVHGKSQEVKVKTEVFTDEDNLVFQHYFYCQKSSTAPTLRDIGTIQIKQEYDWEETLSKARNNEAIWDNNKVKKRKRSKLPQYTLSPLARFINYLRHVSRHGRRPFDKPSANRAEEEGPKYDDFLIYEKCTKFMPENEIGLGAKLLSPPPPSPPVCSTKSMMVVVKEE